MRRSGRSISDVARLVKVSRRSIYNWFSLAILNSDIIYQIGHAIKHDFSVEFPELFKHEDFIFKSKKSFSYKEQDYQIEIEKELLWKDRYFDLLERYKKLIEKR